MVECPNELHTLKLYDGQNLTMAVSVRVELCEMSNHTALKLHQASILITSIPAGKGTRAMYVDSSRRAGSSKSILSLTLPNNNLKHSFAHTIQCTGLSGVLLMVQIG